MKYTLTECNTIMYFCQIKLNLVNEPNFRKEDTLYYDILESIKANDMFLASYSLIRVISLTFFSIFRRSYSNHTSVFTKSFQGHQYKYLIIHLKCLTPADMPRDNEFPTHCTEQNKYSIQLTEQGAVILCHGLQDNGHCPKDTDNYLKPTTWLI